MAFTEMYGFETKDGQQARVDLSQIRSVLPSGSASGYVKAVLDGGNSVTIKGTVDGVYDLIVHYCGKRVEGTAPRVRVSGVGTGVGRTPDVPQVNAVPTRVESSDGRYVGTVFSGPATGNGFDEEAMAAAYLRGSLPKESDESIALRDIAKALGFIGPPDSPQVVVKAVQNLKAHHLQDLREMSWTSRCATLDEVLTAGRETSSATELWTLLHKMRGADKPTYADFPSAQ